MFHWCKYHTIDSQMRTFNCWVMLLWFKIIGLFYFAVNLLCISFLPKQWNRLHAFPLPRENIFIPSCKYSCLFTCSCTMESGLTNSFKMNLPSYPSLHRCNTWLATDSDNRDCYVCTRWRSAPETEMPKPRAASGCHLPVTDLSCHFWHSADGSLPVSAPAARQHAACLTGTLLTLDQLQILSVV